MVPVAEHQLLIKYKVTALSTTRSTLPRRQRGITIKMIIVPEVASRARSKGTKREGKGNGTRNVKETIRYFQRAARSRIHARRLSVAVNASNFTRLISLSLAESSARSRSEDGRRGEKKSGKEQRDDNFAIQIHDLSDSSLLRALLAFVSRRSRSARRLIKFSGNQICHSAVRF